MAYGKLEVYWPDGPIESHWLDKPTVGVGRSSGNDIVLDTNSVSRYHIVLTINGNKQPIQLQDLASVNGTYVDGKRINPNETVSLQGGEEIMIGDLRLIYIPTIEDTRPQNRPETHTIRIATVQAPFSIELEPPPNPVRPGAHMSAQLTISNTGQEVDRFFIEVEGVPQEWVRVERAELELDPGMQVPLTMTFKPLRRSDSRPGDYNVLVRVRAKSKPDQPLQAMMVLHVLPYSGFGIVMATPRITRETPFTIHVHNQGSGPLPMLLSGTSANQSLLISFQYPSITLAPGENRAIQGSVRPKHHRWLGPPRDVRFDVIAHSQDAAGFVAAVPSIFTERAMLPTWILPIVGVAGFLVIAVCLAGILFLARPRTATIDTFSIEPATIYRNVAQQITLRWRVQHAQRLSLQTDPPTLSNAVLPADLTQLTSLPLVITAPNVGSITLIAVGEDGQTIRETRTLQTRPPQCTLLQDVNALAGPAANYPVWRALKAGEPVTIDRRDLSGNWIRLEAMNAWVPSNVLQCTGFAPVDVAFITTEEIPPTPTLTVTPSPTFTPTSTATLTPTPTSTPTVAPSQTPLPSATPTFAPTAGPLVVPSTAPTFNG
jgi:hypothetical protein